KQSFQEALAYVNSQLGKHYPLIIYGEAIETDKKIISVIPADKKVVIGSVSAAGKELAEKAMLAALQAFQTWKKVRPEHRANVLFKA
ncbi:aldehyde dehydrogenase family protein, partial [Lysinibacillus sp. D4A1_S13]|uniref:aldehyde dehydrogenase family protein n=1 Tax=Lysinibacillus sp. D4A1_S13 TaxID=2941228 RepID=UPI0020BF6AA7